MLLFSISKRHEEPLHRYFRTWGFRYYHQFLLVFTVKKAADLWGDDGCGLTPYEIVDVADDGNDDDGELVE